MTDTRPELTIITTCYNEGKTIREFHARLSDTLRRMKCTYEIIYVNDGGSDDTYSQLESLFEADESVALVADLMYNVGQPVAISVGFSHAQGRKIIVIDSDLQLAPEELPLLLDEFNKGYSLVSGYRKVRYDSLGRRVVSRVANMLLRKAMRSNFRDFGCTFKVFDANLVHAFEYGPFRPLQPASLIACARRQTEVPVSHFPRKTGHSSYSYWKLFLFTVDNVVDFIRRPFIYLGLMSGVALAIALLFMLLRVFWNGETASGMSQEMLLAVLLLNSFLSLGAIALVGEFCIRNFITLQQKPAYIIRAMRSRAGHGEAAS